MSDHKLPDVLQENLRVVFCGTAAGRRSSKVWAYYAQSSNQFWPVLHRAGFTSTQLLPADFRQCLKFGIGLTDLAKNVAGVDADVEDGQYDRRGLLAKLERYRPALLALTSKNTGKKFFNQKRVDYGPAAQIDATVVWILPSTSGNARKYWDEEWWRQLAEVSAQSALSSG